jgi:hypothetical protein
MYTRVNYANGSGYRQRLRLMIKTVRTVRATLKSTLKANGAHHAEMTLKNLRGKNKLTDTPDFDTIIETTTDEDYTMEELEVVPYEEMHLIDLLDEEEQN